jgi:dolichyl-phosphate-mannose-protein mannosyltransferase
MTAYNRTIEEMPVFAGEFDRGRKVFALLVLVILASTLTIRTGRLGFMPLDQSIIFDGGWRVLTGQVPLVDFFTPTGLVPLYLQALMFKVAGVSWTAYILHAALLNVLFALSVYFLLRRIFRWNWVALYFALAAACFLYPPMGTPYMDQHALIFTFIMLGLLLCGACEHAALARRICWALVPLAGALAYHSKQNPSAFAIVFVAAAAIFLAFRDPVRYRLPFLAMICSAVLVLASGLLFLAANDIALGDYWYWMVELPLGYGSSRIATGDDRIILVTLLWVGSSIPIGIGVRFALWGNSDTREWHDTLAIIVVAAALLSLAAIYSATTHNAPIFAFAYYPPALALAYGLLSRRLPQKMAEDIRVRDAFLALFLALGFMTPLLAVTPLSQRWANEFEAHDVDTAMPGGEIHTALTGLRWIFPRRVHEIGNETSVEAYRDLLEFFNARDDNFLFFGDATIMYALAGRPSVFPALWFHEGLSFPAQQATERPRFERRLTDALVRYDVRFVVLDGTRTWNRATSSQFGVLQACLADGDGTRRHIGRFQILPIAPGCVRRFEAASSRNRS